MNVQIPKVPNFIRVGYGERMMISVAEFSEEELRAIGHEWTEALIKRAKEREKDQ